MENKPLPIKPEYLLQVILTKRWFLIIPFIIVASAGCILAVISPKVYEASTTILVQPQKVPGNYVRSIVSTSINARISTISQQILSRTNLEKIIKQFKLFSQKEYEKMFLEDKIEILRKRISINLTRSSQGADAFTISYKGTPPKKVMQVANTLAAFFMDENLKIREAQAIGTSDFLDSELEKTKLKLEEHEKEISNYRIKNLGGLPEELDSNLRTLDRFQGQLTAKQTALRETQAMLTNLEKLSNTMNEFDTDSMFEFDSEDDGDAFGMSENQEKLEAASKQLENLLLRYKERHPDVLKLKKAIASLQEKVDEEQQVHTEKVPEKAEGSAEKVVLDINAPQKKQLSFQISKLQKEIDNIENSMAVVQRRVEETPRREQELLSLKRDYSNIQDTYNSLLSRKLEAEIAVNMEKKQKGEQFRILDFARLPEKPISPNLKMIMLMSIACGLGLGGGIIFLMEYFNTTLKGTEEIETYLDIPVLASIPVILQPTDIRKSRFNLVMTILSLFVSLVLLASLAIFADKGVEQSLAAIRSRMFFL